MSPWLFVLSFAMFSIFLFAFFAVGDSIPGEIDIAKTICLFFAGLSCANILFYCRAKVIVSDDCLCIRKHIFVKSVCIRWEDIKQLKYANLIIWSHWLYVNTRDKKCYLINWTITRHRQLIKEVVAHTPMTAEVDPRLFTDEIDRNEALIAIMWFIGGAVMCYILNVMTHGGFMDVLNKILGKIGL